jgi:hypothetical protein
VAVGRPQARQIAVTVARRQTLNVSFSSCSALGWGHNLGFTDSLHCGIDPLGARTSSLEMGSCRGGRFALLAIVFLGLAFLTTAQDKRFTFNTGLVYDSIGDVG